MRKTVIRPWTPAWAQAYLKEKEVLTKIFQDEFVNIYHIGSTSIPSIRYAKPIIDILIVVKNITKVDLFNDQMKMNGYEPKGEFGIPGRRYFPKGGNHRTHHVHIFQAGDEAIALHLDFKDYLLAHPQEAAAYGELKRTLAKRFPDNTYLYQQGKEAFVNELVEKAKRWAVQETRSTYVDWGGQKVKMTWVPSDTLPSEGLITSAHGFCFWNEAIMLVDLDNRGWDLPGGHIEEDETAASCFKREAMEEGYVDGVCTLLGYLEVNHEENDSWNEQSPYPQIGYQVFYRMDITQLFSFKGDYESSRRIFIQPEDVSKYFKGWSELVKVMVCDASRLVLKWGK